MLASAICPANARAHAHAHELTTLLTLTTRRRHLDLLLVCRNWIR